jgi:hypothetical protein
MPDARRVRSFFLVLVLCALTSVPVLAQMATATLSGVITDPKGAVVPDTEVTATRIETGTVSTNKTNGAGIYFFTGLKPGHYHLIVRKPGFKEIAIKEFQLSIQDKLEQNFSLEIGSVSETVTVEASGPVINTTDASVGTVIDRNFVESLPLNGRSFNTLLQLTPGVVIAGSASYSTSPGQFSIAGQRADANNFTVDGVSADFGVSTYSDAGNSGVGGAQAFSVFGGTSSLVSVDALQEFRIETSSFAPEFGRTPGGQVVLTTRSGANELHGGAFDYFRNTVLDANDWFANNAGIPRAQEHHNDFGGFLGGPIWRDRTFYFFSYEGARLDLPETALIQVPSLYARTQASASIAPFLDAYPLPNGQPTSPIAYTAPLTGSFSNRGTLDATSIRIDHTINSIFSVFGRYNYAPSQLVERVGGFNELDTFSNHTQTFTVGLNMALSNNLANTLRANYSQQASGLVSVLDSFGGATPPDLNLLTGSLPSASTLVLFFPFDVARYDAGPQARNKARQLNFVDDLSKAVGKHALKFGGDYRAIFLDTNPAQHNLSYESSNVQSLVSSGQATLGAGTNQAAKLLTQAFSWYAQDSWQITSRLTMTYGLRWELNPAPTGRGTTTLASWQDVNTPADITLAPPGTHLWRTTFGNVAPRLGIAYSLTEKGDLVLRAGVGVFYDTGLGSVGSLATWFPNNFFQSYPGVSLPVSNISTYLPKVTLQPPYGFSEGFSPTINLPRSYQWNVALEKSFAGKQVVSATYLGQAGRDLLRQEALFQPNPNFSGEFLLTLNDAFSNYNAFQLQYRKGLSSRLQALLSYSFSHSLDNASNDSVAGLSNTVISGATDYASSDFDVRHSFSGAFTYMVPSVGSSGPLSLLTRDWSLNAVVVARSGFPFNAIVYSTSPDPGGYATSRPDIVLGQPIWLYGSQCISIDGPPCAGGKGLNPTAFSIPSTVRQGTEGRNDIAGFGLTQIDLSVSRDFPLGERLKLAFRADAFNFLNHPNFGNPPGNVEFGTSYLQSQFMLNQTLGGLNPLFQEGGPRSLQLSLRLSF